MSFFDINIGGIQNEISDTKSQSKRIRQISSDISSCAAAMRYSVSNPEVIAAVQKIAGYVLDEAVKEESFSSALDTIARYYVAADRTIATGKDVDPMTMKDYSQLGEDKRSLLRKLFDWLLNRDVDPTYTATTKEQEKAADEAMKRRLWEVLQDEKYSQEHWENADIEERKQILQDYMREVIAIYGLQDVKGNVIWDPNATYTDTCILWGYYDPDTHTVTLNEQALSDTRGGWDSYELLETVSHELRHAYQHEAVNHPDRYRVSKETIDIWKDNLNNYISSDGTSEGFRKYWNQPVEVDARDFQVTRDDDY